VPLLGNAEKNELEALIRTRLTEHFERHGAGALLSEGLRVVVTGNGVLLDAGETPNPLAAVDIRSLFTAVCYLEGASRVELPREALGPLAAEAMSAATAQINRFSAP